MKAQSPIADAADEYAPELTPYPEQICKECRHRAGNHHWLEVPRRELVRGVELSARRLACDDCPSLRRGCVYVAQLAPEAA